MGIQCNNCRAQTDADSDLNLNETSAINHVEVTEEQAGQIVDQSHNQFQDEFEDYEFTEKQHTIARHTVIQTNKARQFKGTKSKQKMEILKKTRPEINLKRRQICIDDRESSISNGL